LIDFLEPFFLGDFDVLFFLIGFLERVFLGDFEPVFSPDFFSFFLILSEIFNPDTILESS